MHPQDLTGIVRSIMLFRRLLVAVAIALALFLVAVLASGCGEGRNAPDATSATGETTTSIAQEITTTTLPASSTSTLEPIVVPTLPAETPSYTEVDPATGLHMTGTPQVVDFPSYRLKVSGKVAKELDLTYDEIRSMSKVTATPTLVCPGYFKDTATWSGVPIREVLGLAGVQPGAKSLRLVSADGYRTTVSLEDAQQPENFLAYELEGEPLPVLHGFPLRAVFPNKYGSYWVKWLVGIEVE